MTRLFILALLAMSGLSFWAAWTELRGWAVSRAGLPGTGVPVSDIALPLSLSGRSALLRPCLDQATDPVRRLASRADQGALARDCAALARRLAPTQALRAEQALAAALSQHATGRDESPDRLRVLLDESREAAPRTGWLALRRVDLIAAAPSLRGGRAMAGLEADLAVLLADAASRDLVEARYAGWDASMRAALRKVLRQMQARAAAATGDAPGTGL